MKEFVTIERLAYLINNMSDDKENGKFIIIQTYGDYTLIYRNTKYQPWIVAYAYDEGNQCWGHGTYLNEFDAAIACFYKKTERALTKATDYVCLHCKENTLEDEDVCENCPVRRLMEDEE